MVPVPVRQRSRAVDFASRQILSYRRCGVLCYVEALLRAQVLRAVRTEHIIRWAAGD